MMYFSFWLYVLYITFKRIRERSEFYKNDRFYMYKLDEKVKNLGKSSKTGSLVFLDNENAFYKGYSLMYAAKEWVNTHTNWAKGMVWEMGKDGKWLQAFHQKMLETTCVFRRKTVQRLFALYKDIDPSESRLQFVSRSEPLFNTRLPKLNKNSFFRQRFKERIHEVWKWIKKCQLNLNQN